MQKFTNQINFTFQKWQKFNKKNQIKNHIYLKSYLFPYLELLLHDMVLTLIFLRAKQTLSSKQVLNGRVLLAQFWFSTLVYLIAKQDVLREQGGVLPLKS